MCGCTDMAACVNDVGRRCAWAGPNICTACANPEFWEEQTLGPEASGLVLPGDPEFRETTEALRG